MAYFNLDKPHFYYSMVTCDSWLLDSIALGREEVPEVSIKESWYLEAEDRRSMKVEEQPGKSSVVEVRKA